MVVHAWLKVACDFKIACDSTALFYTLLRLTSMLQAFLAAAQVKLPVPLY